MPFPLTPVPSYYATVTHANRSGIYYAGGAKPSVTLSQPTVTDYYIKDYYGNTVETGHISSATLTVATAFNPGWYRVYMTGASTDVTFGPSYGAWSFVILPVDSRFVTNPAPGTGTGQGGGEAHDAIMKGVLGIGTSRVQIGDASSPTTFPDNINTAEIFAGFADTYWNNPTLDTAVDSNRHRTKFMQFPNRTFDRVDLNSPGAFARVYKKDSSINGSTTFVGMTGSSGNWTVTIYSPDASTPVETYPGLANGTALQTATATSNYVRAFNAGSGGATTSPTAIGDAYYNGVVSAVSQLYPYGYTYFEGPSNEGTMTVEQVHAMQLFQSAVHAGNADAKALGPCFVDINTLTGTTSWTTFLAGGGGTYCDEISTHMYNSQTNGDINLGRTTIEAWRALLATYSQDSKPFWHTEATQVYIPVLGVHHPRRARVPLLMTLLMEQYGLPREKNLYWYDTSHGFWSQPDFLISQSGPVPTTALYRTLAAETFGMTHYHRLDFGCRAANKIWLGSLYVQNKNTLGPSTLVLAMNSYMPGATVDLTITGTTDPITYVDGFGNTATATQSSGRVTIPTADIPTYVRLPAGVTATIYQVNDWGTSPPPSISSYGTATASQMSDDAFLSKYASTATGVYTSPNLLPDTAQIMFLANATFQRVVIFCGGAWQNLSALTTFTVDTWDGSSWTTQKTVDVSAGCTSFQHGTDSHGEGCKQETYWPEQWIFDVKFAAPVTALGVRINVSNASYGGEPDAAAKAAGGQGANAPKITLQEMMVFSTSTPGL